MSTFVLVTNVRQGTRLRWAGSIADDTTENITALRATPGCVLWPTGDNEVIDAAALEARKIRDRGGNMEEAQALMNAALAQVEKDEPRPIPASAVVVVDVGGYFDSTNVEGMGQEIGASLETIAEAVTDLADDIAELTAADIAAVDTDPELGSEEVQGQLDAIKALALAGGGGTTNFFIYREGAVSPVAPVYASLDAAYVPALALQNAGIPSTIFIDGSLGSPVSGVGSTYRFDTITLAGTLPGAQQTALAFQEGSHIKRLSLARGIAFENASSTSIWDVTSGESGMPTRVELHDCSVYSPGVTPVPFFQFKVNTLTWFDLYGTTNLGQGTGTVDFQEDIEIFGVATFWLYDRSSVDFDCIGGGSLNLSEYALRFNVVDPAASPPATLANFLFNIQGWTTTYLAEASRINGIIPGNVFTYRPGGVTAGTVYATFLEAYNAAFATGALADIIIDTAFDVNTEARIGAGSYDLSKIRIIGFPTGQSYTLNHRAYLYAQPGATFSKLPRALVSVSLFGNGTAPLYEITTTDDTDETIELYDSALSGGTPTTDPIILFTEGSSVHRVRVRLDGRSSIGAAGAFAAFGEDVTSSVFLEFTTNGVGCTINMDSCFSTPVLGATGRVRLLGPAAFVALSGSAVSGVNVLQVINNLTDFPEEKYFITFKPGVASADETYATWAEIKPLLQPGVYLVIDDSLAECHVLAADGTTDCTGVRFYGGLGYTYLYIDDGAVLHNVNTIWGVTFYSDATTTIPMTYTGVTMDGPYLQSFIYLKDFGALESGPSATLPMANAGPNVSLQFYLSGSYIYPDGAQAPLGTTGNGNLLIQAFNRSYIDPNSVEQASAGGTCRMIYDASSGPIGSTYPGVSETAADNAFAVGATDTAPLLGSTTVQGQLDALKTISGNVFTYKQGATTSGRIYATFALAAAAAIACAAIVGKAKIIIDNSGGACVTGAAGALDLSKVDLEGAIESGGVLSRGTTLTWQTGTTVSGLGFGSVRNLIFQSTSTAAICTIGTSGGQTGTIALQNSAVYAGSLAPFFNIIEAGSAPYTNILYSVLEGESFFAGAAGQRVAQFAVNTFGQINLYGGPSGYTLTAFGGLGLVDVECASSAATNGALGALPTTQTNMAGFSVTFDSRAAQVTIADAGSRITATTVEGALQEVFDPTRAISCSTLSAGTYVYAGPSTAGAMPTVGAFRMQSGDSLTSRYNLTTDYSLIGLDAAAGLYIGVATSGSGSVAGSVNIWTNNTTWFVNGGATQWQLGVGSLTIYPNADYAFTHRTDASVQRTLTIQAANTTTGAGGILVLSAGTGTTAYGSVEVTGAFNPGLFSKDMNNTLYVATAAESANNMIIVSGIAFTADRTLTLTRPPTNGTRIEIRNNAAPGAFGVTVQFASGAATAAILPGTSAVIVGDGTNAVILILGA